MGGGTASEDALATYLELSAYSSDSDEPDIIVWPETAVSVDLGYYESYARKLEKFSAESGSTLIIGAFSKDTDYDENENRITKTYNSVYAVSPDGTIGEETVSKKHLVPFGEYVPLGGLLERIMPSLSKLNLSGTELTSGSDSSLLYRQMKAPSACSFAAIRSTPQKQDVRLKTARFCSYSQTTHGTVSQAPRCSSAVPCSALSRPADTPFVLHLPEYLHSSLRPALYSTR